MGYALRKILQHPKFRPMSEFPMDIKTSEKYRKKYFVAQQHFVLEAPMYVECSERYRNF